MKIIKRENATTKSNSSTCTITEYSFGNKDSDLSVATINGRCPENGYGLNEKCNELALLIEGQVTLTLKGTNPELINPGDSVLLNAGEPYFWNGNCKMIISCSPAWNADQYKIVK